MADFPKPLFRETESAVAELATSRSDFIRMAVDAYLRERRAKKLQEQLIEGYTANANAAREIAEELIVAVVTGAENVPRRYPVDVPIPRGEAGLTKDSVIQCNLIRCVDEKRLLRSMGHVTPRTMEKVDAALRISLGL